MSLLTQDLFDMKGRVCLVTGGSRGLGLMMARAFVVNGATVYISSRKKDACDQAASELTKLGPGKAFSLPSELNSDAAARALAAAVAERESRLDVLVNNAGITWGASFESFPEEQWQKVMNVNVASIFHLTRACTPLLEKAAKGNTDPAHVINIGSVAGSVTGPGALAPSYEASKAAVDAVTRYLASTLIGKHINVNCIGPAVFESKMTQHMFKSEESTAQRVRLHPIGRIGNSTDIAGLSIFLATKASAFITGSTIYLDGGMMNVRAAL